MATIRKRGSKWQVQIRREHAPNLSRSFTRRCDAEAWGREMEVDVDRRLLKHDPRILDHTTVGDLIARYRDTISIDKCDAKIEMDRLSRVLKLPIAKLSLSAVDATDFAAHRDARLGEVSAATINRELAPLQHMFQIAMEEWGLPISTNPLKLVRRPRNNNARDRRLHSVEEERLFIAASKSKVGYIKPAIRVALETSMRRSEILNIAAEHLCERSSRLLIPKTKTHRPRKISLSEPALDATLGLLKAYERSRPSRNAFRLCWERTRTRAGLEDLHFHDLRHEAISRYFERGMTMPEIASLSGHSDFRMLARYAHVAP